MSATGANFPQINHPLVDDRGNITQPWLQVLIALYNRTGGSGGGISTILDTIDHEQGSILYRGPEVWSGLNAGEEGNVLQTNGPGKNPAWSPRVKEIGTGIGLTGGPIVDIGSVSMAKMPGQTIKGNAGADTDDPADLTPSEVKDFLNYIASGDAAAGDLSGTYPAPVIGANKVSNSKLAKMNSLTVKGNSTGASANPQDLDKRGLETILLPGQPNCLAYLSATSAATSGSFAKVPFDATQFNVGGYFDTSSSRFTPLVAGTYFVSVTVYGSGSPVNAVAAAINKNGTNIASVGLAVSAGGNVSVSLLVQMNGTTDYLEGWGEIDGTTPEFMSIGSDRIITYFHAFRIGP